MKIRTELCDGEKRREISPRFKVGDKIQCYHGCGTVMTIERIENGKYIFADCRGRVPIEDGNCWSLIGPEVKVDWDEEDGKKFESVLWHLRHSVNNGDTDHSAGQLEGWLISLKDRIDPESHWTEEDVDMFGSILSTLGICMNNPDIPKDVRKMHRKEYNWFNELYNRVLPTGRGEWSDKDEGMRIRTLGALASFKTEFPMSKVDEEMDWLKSLKQRDIKLPTQEVKNVTEMCEKYSNLTDNGESVKPGNWRPSDKQLQALANVVAEKEEEVSILNSLYKQLKKI